MRTYCVAATAIVALTMAACPAAAHPGSGIAVDRVGNVYFVGPGVNVVWKLERDGRVTKFIEDDIVRLPHHLLIGRDGALYFASDFDGRIWRADSTGVFTEHFNTNRIVGHPQIFVGQWGDPWTIDSSGAVYALSEASGAAVVRISLAGVVTPLARGAKFGPLHASSMVMGSDGALYVTDANRVWRIVGDSATMVAGHRVPLANGAGIAVADDGSIYVADWTGRRVIHLARDGGVTTSAALAGIALDNPWGVTIAPDGSVYVLDFSRDNRGVAIWRVQGDTAERLYVGRSLAMFVAPALLTLFPLLFVLQAFARKAASRTDWLLWTLVTSLVVGSAWWVGGTVWIFSWLRHALVALFAYAAWISWRRVRPVRLGA